MNYGLIAIYDTDSEYANCLADYFRLKGCLSSEIVVFTRKNSFDNFSAEHNIDILVADQSLKDEVKKCNLSRNVFLLCDHERTLEPDIGYCLFKYSSGEVLLREIMANYEPIGSANVSFSLSKGTKLIGIYSPVCRCGKTSFSLSLAIQYGLNSSCLFLSMDEASPLRYLLSSASHRKTLDDLLYYYLQTPEVFESRLLSVVNQFNGVDVILPSDKPAPFNEMSMDDWISFFSCLANIGRYKYIILDFGNISPIYPLLPMCHKLYMPEPISDNYAQDKISLFMDNLHIALPNDNIQFQRVNLPHVTYHRNDTDYIYELSSGDFAHVISSIMGDS